MIVDTSALLAILKKESDASLYASALSQRKSKLISAANFLEAFIGVDANREPILSRPIGACEMTRLVPIEPA